MEVTYEVHTEPGGSVPSWLANSFVVDAPLQTLRGLRLRMWEPAHYIARTEAYRMCNMLRNPCR